MKRKFFRIPIEVGTGGLLFFILVAMVSYVEVCDIENQTLMYLAGWILFIALLGSLLAHALAHCSVARTMGMEIEKIKIIAIGVVEVPCDYFSTPKQEFFTAIAGPAASLILAGIFYLLAPVLRKYTIFQTLGYAAHINAMWGLFNLAPIFPMDGGRVVHAILWKIFKHKKATNASTIINCVLATVIGVLTVYEVAALAKYDHIFPAILVGYLALNTAVYRKKNRRSCLETATQGRKPKSALGFFY